MNIKWVEMKIKVSLEEAKKQLNHESMNKFTTVMQHGTMKVEFYKPEKVDLQKPHIQDEIYVITSGTGIFIRNEEKVSFKPNDVLFVPAGVEHRFEKFTDDFTTWVIFYGKDGGE